MWICPKCGEKIEDQFDSCWKCAAPEETNAPQPTTRKFRVALGLGILIEAVILPGLLLALPHESALWIHTFNFAQYTHYPLLRAFGPPDSMLGGILVLLLVATIMAMIWAGALLLIWNLLLAGFAKLGWSGREKRVIGWAVAAVGGLTLLFFAAEAIRDRPTPFTASPALRSVVAGNTALAIDLYHQLRQPAGNIFVSPFSISSGLALTYAGARGATETEIAHTAHFALGQTNLHAAFPELFYRLSRLEHGRKLTLVSANGLWRQRGHPFLKPFLDIAAGKYKAELTSVDFLAAPADASSRINSWVAAQTRGKIHAVCDPGQFGTDTSLVLCDAVYFKGNWRSQFKKRNTQPAPFHVTSNESVSVPMMRQEAEFRTTRVEDVAATLIALPYYGGDLEMVIILPDEVDGLAQVESGLTPERLDSWLARLEESDANKTWVLLPRFSIRKTVDLVPVLKSLGMVTAFSKESADLSGMDGTSLLYLSEAVHQAFVEVNETGTEAAAATLFEAKSRGQTARFVADHPFLFLIRDKGSGLVLFLGRLVAPTN